MCTASPKTACPVATLLVGRTLCRPAPSPSYISRSLIHLSASMWICCALRVPQMERIISLCNRNYASPVPPGASSEPCQVQQGQQQIREEEDSEEDGEQDTGGGATVSSVSTTPEALESSQGSKWSRTLSSSSTVHDQLDVQTPQQQEACRHLYQDLYVQEKKVSRATEQLACLRYTALRQGTEFRAVVLLRRSTAKRRGAVRVELIVALHLMLTGYSSRFLSSSKLKPNLPWTR